MGLVHRSYQALARAWAERARLMESLEEHEAHAALAWEQEEIWIEYAVRARHEFNLTAPGSVVT